MQTSKIKSISKINKNRDKYDIEIEDNHNFFANDILVHNCRCIERTYPNKSIKFTSRGGLDFLNLDILKAEFERFRLDGTAGDGEICLVDENGNEDFQRVMKVIRKKNYTIPFPRYCMFDLIPLDDFDRQESNLTFEQRQRNLSQFISSIGNSRFINKVDQVLVRDWSHLQELKDIALANNWEGLILRKNTTYEADRSNNMLKCKVFIDAEFIVQDVEMGPIRYIEYDKDGKSYEKEDMMLSAIMISFEDNIVRVGSGFSLEERKRYCSHPNDLIGKQVTIKYFQKSVDQNGKSSLRFPTLKYIWEDGDRDEVE